MTPGISTRLRVILRKSKRGSVQPASPKSKRDGHSALSFLAFGLVIVLLLQTLLPLGSVVADSPLTVQPPSKDNYLDKVNPTSNYGTSDAVHAYNRASRIRRAILEFDISSIPEGQTITGATLSLYYWFYSGTNPSGLTAWTYKQTHNDWVETESTWNIYKTGSSWTAVGGDYVTSDPAGGSTTFPAAVNAWMNWDVTAIVQDAYNNDYGVAEFLTKFADETLTTGYTYVQWYSKDYVTDLAKRPKLVITYESATVAPTVVTNNETDVSYTWGYTCANITATGGENATTRGFQWGTSTGNYTSSWNETGDYGISEFCHNITGLGCNETYYFRGFAVNSAGTGYGGEETFTTTACDAPTTTTSDATGVSYTAATVHGNITVTGGPDATTRGFEYDTDGADPPFTFDWHEDGTFGTGTFEHELSPLSDGQLYYFRAYATGPGGTGYGSALNFTTLDYIAPTVVTNNATDVSYTIATLNGNVTDIGSHNATTRGFEWDIDTGAPYANDWHEDGTFEAGTFSRNLTLLTDGIPYYYRAYATNPGGTTYGDEVTFNTTAYTAPVVTNTAATNITINSAIMYGNVTAIGGQNITVRGFDWGYETGNYTLSWNETGSWGTGEFSYTLTGLTSGATVYWLAWATNPEGRGNSTELSFEVGELPAAPGNFTIEHGLLDIYVLTWDMGYKADSVVIVGNEDGYPTSPTDGYVLYAGNATTCTLAGVNPDLEACYFRAWSLNTYGYSTDNAEAEIGDQLGLTAIVFIAGMAGFALWKKGWLRILLSLCLIIFGVATFTYDVKVAAPLIGLGVILFILATMRQISVAKQGGES